MNPQLFAGTMEMLILELVSEGPLMAMKLRSASRIVQPMSLS